MKRWGAAAGLTLLIACGGDDGVNVGGLTCGTAPCGGDPIGDWTIEASCVEGDFEIEQCPEAVVQVAVDVSGSVSINPDMSYSIEVTTAGFLSSAIPASCIPAGQITDCSDLDSEELSCTGDPALECDCRQTVSQQNSESGTWSTSGNQITFDDGAGGVTTNDYCVSGDAASVSTTNDVGLRLEILMTR